MSSENNSTLSTSTSHIILKSLEHVFKLSGLSLIGAGAVIGINDLSSSVITLLSSIFLKYSKDENKDKKNDDRIINLTWRDTYTTLERVAKSCGTFGSIVSLGIVLRKLGAFAGQDYVIEFFNTEKH